MIRKFCKLFASLSIVILITTNFFQPGSAQSSMAELKAAQNEPLNCTSITGPLVAGVSSTVFPTGELYKVGTSFNCVDMHEAKAIGVGDFNNDGRNDVVLVWSGWPGSTSAYNIYIFWQDTQGSLSTTPTVYPAGNTARQLAVGDLNGDGLDDFATETSVFIQHNDGTIVRTVYPVLEEVNAIAIGDINNDDLDDVAVSIFGWSGDSHIGVFTQSQEGTLNTLVKYPTIRGGFDDIAIGDVNHDGLNDVVKLNGQGTTDLMVYLQNSEGQLSDYVSHSLGPPMALPRGTSLAIGDLTGDGRSDIVVSYAADWSYSKLAVFAQDSSGSILPPVSYLAWGGQQYVEIADINADGRQDVITSHQGWQHLGVFLQDPDGTLAWETLYPVNYSYVWGMAFGDLNNDTLVDLIAIDSRGFDVLYHGSIFSDLSLNYWAGVYITRLYKAGITGGCGTSPLQYCPETIVTRSQMAVFLLRGIHGSSYGPPAVGGSTGFGDVPVDYWSAAWIKQLAAEGITGGCGSGNYCPEYPVTRDQMAVFLLRSKYGASYSPPAVGASTGFGDVPVDHWAAPWIKQLVTEGITAGCGSGNYCPELPVTRAQMAVFLVRTFNLP